MMIKQPLKIKNVTVNNRIAMPPMASEKSSDGRVIPEHHTYYTKRCGKGHIGLVITEHMYIMPQAQATPGQIYIGDDESVAGLRGLTAAIHGGGAKCFAQINHAGFKAPESLTGCEPAAPSALEQRLKNGDVVLPRELGAGEMAEIKSAFAAAAARAKAAGFDGVEIHGAHGYLLCQFYSPLCNKRRDAYGGSLENRVRFHLEVIAAVREAVGEDYPVAIRMGGCDYTEGGSTIADCVEACKLFEKAGIDLIDLSGGMCSYQPAGKEAPYFEDMARAVKAAVSVPVLLTGGIVDAGTARRLLEEKACDLVGIGRALLRDPDWAENQVYNC